MSPAAPRPLPLAIELAAAHSKLLNPRAIVSRLSSPLAALVHGSRDLPARQKTLRRTIEWSYNLLDDAEKALFDRLGVFAVGWTIEAMQEVSGEGLALDTFEGLESLVNKSLVRQHEIKGEPRFEMLGVIRDYALEQLALSGERETIRRRHARYFTELAVRAGQCVWAAGWPASLHSGNACSGFEAGCAGYQFHPAAF